jgi:hypothetical protein
MILLQVETVSSRGEAYFFRDGADLGRVIVWIAALCDMLFSRSTTSCCQSDISTAAATKMGVCDG